MERRQTSEDWTRWTGFLREMLSSLNDEEAYPLLQKIRSNWITFFLLKEVENHVGEELCRLFPEDSDTEWSAILRRSKESARRLASTNGGTSGRNRGPMAPLQLQQQHFQHSNQAGHGGRRGYRDRNRSRGGFGSSRDNHSSGDMGRYTAQINQKRLHPSKRTFSVACASTTLHRWLSGRALRVP